jgi:predicted ATPase/DNA-binding SARP family transcriptional activator
MEFRILGPLEVRAAGTTVDLGPPRQRVLLSVLLLYANHVVSIERLVDVLWQKPAPDSAVAMIHVRISELRKSLRIAEGDRGATVRTRRPGYQLVVDDDQIDAKRFEKLALSGRQAAAHGNPAMARRLLREALDLWRGPVLPDVTHLAVAKAERGRLEELRLRTIEDRVDADLAYGCHIVVAGELEALVVRHPLREKFWRQLMLARYRSGRQAEALHAYQQARDVLMEALGAEPGRELQDLHQAVLRHDPGLALRSIQRTAGERRSNLPARLSSFVDRVADLANLVALLGRARLVTVTGAGGVGKSRTALELAATQLADYPDGCWLVELSSILDPELVTPAIATVLGVHEHPDRPLIGLLVARLRTARTLLVLDNCEHLVDEVAVVTQPLLAACEHLRVLATSRERIGVPGESVYHLGGLEVPEGGDQASAVSRAAAARLFVDRVTAVRGTFQLSPATAPAVSRICRRLDGLPLAIELAAARMSAFDVDQIEARLDDRFALLSQGSRAERPHHQTLTAVFDWSYHLLDDTERRLFDRLSIFVGGFDLDAVQAVCVEDQGTPAADPLARLVDKSLVTLVQADSSRYGLLETLREYGRRHLRASGEQGRTAAAHAAYYRSLAESAATAFRGPDEASWLRRLSVENGNLRAGLRWSLDGGDPDAAVRFAAALHHFWDLRGQYREGRGWLRQALELTGRIAPASRGWAWYGAGELAMIQGDYLESARCFDNARDLFHVAGDATGLADSLRYLGYLHIHSHDHDTSCALLTEALANARTAGSCYAEGWALLFLAVLEVARRDFVAARDRATEGERVLRTVGQREGIGWALLCRGAADWQLGDLAAAVVPMRSGLDLFVEIQGMWGISLGLLVAGMVAGTRKLWPTAVELISASETLRDEIGASTQSFFEEWITDTLAGATTAIGTELFERHWRTGTTTSLENSLANARSMLLSAGD